MQHGDNEALVLTLVLFFRGCARLTRQLVSIHLQFKTREKMPMFCWFEAQEKLKIIRVASVQSWHRALIITHLLDLRRFMT